jgi:hypothetical protein
MAIIKGSLVSMMLQLKAAIALAFMTILSKSVMMEINGGGTAAGLFSDHSFSFSRTFDAYPYISDKFGNVI